jgi:sensor histidine kinase YesM
MSVRPPLFFAPISFLKNRLLTHSVFWAIYLSVTFVSSWGSTYVSNFWEVFIIDTVSNVVFCYVVILVLIPRLLYQYKFILFVLLSIIWIAIMCVLNYYLFLYALRNVPNDTQYLRVTDFLSINVLLLFLITAIKFGKDLLIIQHETELAQRDKIQQELSFLRAQLSPHFLLNTMNNLYGLSVIKSDELPALMLRLSDLLRYTIYDTKTDKVALKNEIEYLLDYIELQKIRMSAKVKLTVDFLVDIPDSWHIAPLLLIVFVENAFKHSQNMVKTSPRFIHFKINIQDNIFTFISENTFEDEPAFGQNKEPNIALRHEGIGLETTLRRIELLYGKGNLPHITKDNGVFRVALTLKNVT